jgi:ArsR family transcriptional regulator
MDADSAILAFSALAQPTRLAVFRELVAHEPEGLPAGEIARRLAVPHNTMSTHLAILARAALVASERHGRSIRYRARPDSVAALAGYLVEECCGGRPETCAEPVAGLASCGPAKMNATRKESVPG